MINLGTLISSGPTIRSPRARARVVVQAHNRQLVLQTVSDNVTADIVAKRVSLNNKTAMNHLRALVASGELISWKKDTTTWFGLSDREIKKRRRAAR